MPSFFSLPSFICDFFFFFNDLDFCFRLQEGLAECIANEDGERQIACAISFHGEETASFLLLPPSEFPISFRYLHARNSILGMKQNNNS